MDADSSLLNKWRGGDALAGQELFRRHTETLQRFFSNKVAGNVDDLVQQTLLACLQGHTRFEERSSFRSYLLGVARFHLFEYYRRHRSDRSRLEYDATTVHDLALSPSLQLAKAGEDRLLLEALRRLPINLQIALELSYWEGMSGPELAEVLEIPVDTVYSRLRRAKQLVKEQLEQLAESREQLVQTHTNLTAWAGSLARAHGQPPADAD